MPSQPANAREYYDRHSREYVSKWSRVDESDPAALYRRNTIRSLLEVAGVSEGSRVVELGAGTGLVLRELLRVTRPVVGADISVEMLRRAQEELSGEWRVQLVDELPADPWHGDSDVYLLRDDVTELSLPALGVDAVLAMEVFRYVADAEGALRRVAAIMGDETVFAFTVTNLWSAGLFPLKYEVRRRLGRVDPDAELQQYFVTEASIRKMLERAGLRLVELRKLNCISFNPLARRLVRTGAGAERVIAADRALARVPLANRCFDTLLVAATRR